MVSHRGNVVDSLNFITRYGKLKINEESNKNEIGERAKLFYSYVDVNLLQKDANLAIELAIHKSEQSIDHEVNRGFDKAKNSENEE